MSKLDTRLWVEVGVLIQCVTSLVKKCHIKSLRAIACLDLLVEGKFSQDSIRHPNNESWWAFLQYLDILDYDCAKNSSCGTGTLYWQE